MPIPKLVTCAYDGCHDLEPGSWNGKFCRECKCKRKYENAKKRLTDPLRYDAEIWELQERKKHERVQRDRAHNQWILDNKSFAIFDIESSNLDADIGEILCACIKPLQGKIETFVALDSDKNILPVIRDRLEEFDYVVAFYGSRFDLPFVNTRLLSHSMRPITTIRLVDPYYAAKFNLKLHSNRMASVEEFLYGKTAKTRLIGQIWNRAMRGDADAMEYIVDHCQADVEILERVFLDLSGMMNLARTPLRRYA